MEMSEVGGRQCTDSQDLYPEVRGEVGDSIQTLRISIKRSDGRWEHTVKPLRTSILMSEGRWETVSRDSGPLSKHPRGGGNTLVHTDRTSI